jgi:hypothetical protein
MSVHADPQPDYRFLHGHKAAPAHPRPVTAGRLTALFDGADLRRIRLGDREIVRRIYTAVRDVNWDTVLPVRSALRFETGERGFHIAYRAEHRKEELDLTATIAIEGRADGSLRFTFDGVANSAFPYCRIGICVLHPPEAAGRPFRAQSPDRTTDDRLPTFVGPQWIRDGKLHALFQPYDRLAIGMLDDLEVTFRFEGDLFEMEDQRNWTDASFKTYSTPLALGFPHQARAGQRFRQTVEVHPSGAGAAATAGQAAVAGEVAITIGDRLRLGLPAIGLGVSSVAAGLGAREIDLLRLVAPDHLRCELHLDEPGAFDGLQAALSNCAALKTGLELALFLGDPESDLARVAPALRGAPVRRFLIFRAGQPCSDGPLVKTARAQLGAAHPRAGFFGGTNIYFADLNRTRPDTTGMDGVTFTITPQVHDSDGMSLMENVQVHADAVRSARALSGEDRDVAISPITLKPRFNPFANRALTQDPDTLPFPVDARQASLFASAWTVGSLKHTVESGAAALTYFETAGWRGLVETELGPPAPHLFPSRPGMIFPVYWVFRDLVGWRDAAVLRCDSSDPLRVAGLALRKGIRTRILVANLTADGQDVRLGPTTSTAEATLTLIDRESFDPVPAEASSASRRSVTAHPADGTLGIHLNPYAVTCIDT